MKDLPVRTLIAVLLIGLLCLVAWFGGWVQAAVLGLFTVAAVYEMFTIFVKRGIRPAVLPQILLGGSMFAVRRIAAEGIAPDAVTEQTIADRLYTSGLPELDLIIRTAGEERLSNFLLWQAAYAEFVFSKTLWPDFTPEVYFGCLREFLNRTRRFGRVL